MRVRDLGAVFYAWRSRFANRRRNMIGLSVFTFAETIQIKLALEYWMHSQQVHSESAEWSHQREVAGINLAHSREAHVKVIAAIRK